MNKRIITSIAALAILTLASCTKEAGGGPGGGIPLRVAPSLAGETKASMHTADLQEFYLQLGCTDAAYGYFGKVSKSGTAWSAAKQLFWKDETTPVSACAAYFGGHAFTAAEFSGGVDLAVPADQSTQAGLNSADLLTLKSADIKYEDTDGGVLPVELNHGLAKVSFVLTLGDAIYDAGIGLTTNPVTAFTVKGANTGFNFKPQTGAVTVTAATQADITPLAGTYTPGTATAKAATALYEAILVPQSFAAGELTVTFSIGLGEYEWSNAEAITLSAGTTVNLHISVTSVPPVDPYNGHAYVDMGNGLKWATCNVGADNPEDYGDYFDWGATVPYYQDGHSQDSPCSDWIDGKDGYNWKNYSFMEAGQSSWKRITKYTFADGQTDGTWWYDGSTFKGDNGDGVEHKDFASYDYADDAARQNWGGNWRTPTDAEWTWLRENCEWTWTTQNGVNGMLVRSKIAGYTDNTIFLPAAGYRSNASLYVDGSGGRYWSSSLGESRSDVARGVDFDSGGVGRGSGSRYYGESVRPVTE